MRITIILLTAAYLLCVQQARADMYSDCDNRCDPATQLVQCGKIAKLPGASAELKALASDRLCVVYFRTRKWNLDMLEACTLAVEHEPTAERYVNLGAAKIVIGTHKSAIKTLTIGMHFNPALGTLYYNRALAYERQGNRKEALADARQAQRLGEVGSSQLIKRLVRPSLPARR